MQILNLASTLTTRSPLSRTFYRDRALPSLVLLQAYHLHIRDIQWNSDLGVNGFPSSLGFTLARISYPGSSPTTISWGRHGSYQRTPFFTLVAVFFARESTEEPEFPPCR